jgi:hypothetical protein
MPVEDRIRQGLEANATSYAPQGEVRLEQVHRRRRRHNGAVAASLGLVAAVLATVVLQVVPGWSGSTPPTADAPRWSSTDPVERVAAVPVGGWFREVTAKKGLALGISRRRVERLTGDDGVLQLGLKMEQRVFTIYTNDAWDTGTYASASGHRLVLTSMSSSCPGCVTTLTWRQLGRDVVFPSVTRDRAGLLARWFYEGRWNYG